MADLRPLARAWASLPQILQVRASADGAWAFWCAMGGSEVADVYCAPLGGTGMVEQLTFGTDHHQIRDVSSDGQLLILAQSRHGDEHDHLLALDRRVGNRLHLLTPKQDSHFLSGGSLTRDGRSVIFLADYDYARAHRVEEVLVWQQDLTSGARRCLARLPPGSAGTPSLSPSGQRILLHRSDRGPGSAQIWVMNADGEGLREVFAMGRVEVSRGTWLDDDRIVVVTERMGRDELGIFTLSTGATRWLGGEPELCPQEVVAGQGVFACIAHKSSQSRAVLFDASGARPFVNRSGRRSLLPRAALPDGAWLAEAYDADGPSELVRVAPDGLCQRLSTAPAAPRRHIAPQEIWWSAPDGQKVQGWLYRPEAAARGLVVHVHPGPQAQAEDQAHPQIGFWVQLGYAVLAPNPRGSTGFGQAWRQAIAVEGWGGAVQGDLVSGIAAVLKRGYAPPAVAITGEGFGGYCCWHALTHAGDLVGVALPLCAPHRLQTLPQPSAPPEWQAAVIRSMGGTPEEAPLAYAPPGPAPGRIRGRLLIFHGQGDSCVPVQEAEAASRDLTLAGISHEVMLGEGEGHGRLRRSTLERWLIAAASLMESAFAPP